MLRRSRTRASASTTPTSGRSAGGWFPRALPTRTRWTTAPGSSTPRLARFRSGQPAVLRHVTDGVLRFLQLLEQQRKVVVAIREPGVGAQRGLVRLHRFRFARHVLEQNTEVVEQLGIAAAGLHPIAVHALG